MAGKKKALGRGLDALFGDIDKKVPVYEDGESLTIEGIIEKKPGKVSKDAILYVDIDDIKPNSVQPRQSFDPETIEELAASIEAYGVIQPVLVKEAEAGYELIAGERRWRAARKAGLKAVPAIVRNVTSEENSMIALVENIQREDLNPIEEATAFKAIIGKYGMTQETLAKVIGRSRPYVANTLRTLTMPPEIIEMLREGTLSLGHANALGRVKDKKKQTQLAEKIVKNGCSVREAEQLADAVSRKTGVKKKTKTSKSEEITMIEQELTSATGIRVLINGNEDKGNVELRYFDRQGLEEIIELLRNTRVGR